MLSHIKFLPFSRTKYWSFKLTSSLCLLWLYCDLIGINHSKTLRRTTDNNGHRHSHCNGTPKWTRYLKIRKPQQKQMRRFAVTFSKANFARFGLKYIYIKKPLESRKVYSLRNTESSSVWHYVYVQGFSILRLKILLMNI